MKYLPKFAAVMIALAVITCCSSPIGTIDGSRDDAFYNLDGQALWVVPARQIYDIGSGVVDQFDRSTDLHVYVAANGTVGEVPIDDVVIHVCEPSLAGDTTIKHLVVNGYYIFTSAGRKTIEVEYGNLSSWYSIEVRGTYISGDGQDFGMGIKWKE